MAVAGKADILSNLCYSTFYFYESTLYDGIIKTHNTIQKVFSPASRPDRSSGIQPTCLKTGHSEAVGIFQKAPLSKVDARGRWE